MVLVKNESVEEKKLKATVCILQGEDTDPGVRVEIIPLEIEDAFHQKGQVF